MLKKDLRVLTVVFGLVAIVLLVVLILLGFSYLKEIRGNKEVEAKNELIVQATPSTTTEEERGEETEKETGEEACCFPLYVNLDQAPGGVWSNASAVLLAEGWSIVIERDQLWQQGDGVSWQNGATQDFLLLHNEGPGARYYSLQDSFGGRPRDWWNDQAKQLWLFSSDCQVLEGRTVAVLYEHDDGREGWQYAITLDMTLTRKEGKGAITTGDIAIVDTGESEEILPTATQTMPTATPVATSVPEGLPTAQAAPQCLFVGETLVSSDKIRVETNESDNFYDTSVIEVVKGELEVVFENWDGGTRNWSETVTLGPGTYNLESVESGRYNDRLQRICASSPAKVVLFQHHDRTGKTATVIFQ